MRIENVGGKVFVKVGGKVWSAEGDLTVQLEEEKRTAKRAMDGDVVYTTEPLLQFVEGTFYLKGSDDPADLRRENVTVKVELSNGRVGVLNNAEYTGEGIAVSTQNGTFTARWDGRSGQWIS